MRLLSNTLPIPANQVDAPNRDSWSSVERELGVGLPVDYRAFMETYGTGCIDDFIWVFNPFSANEHLNLLTTGHKALKALRQLREQGLYCVEYPLFPEPSGLLPWGITDNGDLLHWLTKGAPDAWSVVITAARDDRAENYVTNTTGFLEDVLTGEIVSRIFPDDFPPSFHSFVASPNP